MEGTGLLFLLVGPSGAGKNTLLNRVLERVADCTQMPTATTRPPRMGEIEGKHHFFLTEDDFRRLIEQGAFAEWQKVHSNRYGTLKATVEEGIRSGKLYIADIDFIGTSALKEQYPDNVISIFIIPSSIAILEQRIRQRGMDSEEEIARRLQRVPSELLFKEKSDYVVINDDLEAATEQIIGIILDKRRQIKDESNCHHRPSG